MTVTMYENAVIGQWLYSKRHQLDNNHIWDCSDWTVTKHQICSKRTVVISIIVPSCNKYDIHLTRMVSHRTDVFTNSNALQDVQGTSTVNSDKRTKVRRRDHILYKAATYVKGLKQVAIFPPKLHTIRCRDEHTAIRWEMNICHPAVVTWQHICVQKKTKYFSRYCLKTHHVSHSISPCYQKLVQMEVLSYDNKIMHYCLRSYLNSIENKKTKQNYCIISWDLCGITFPISTVIYLCITRKYIRTNCALSRGGERKF